MQAAKVLRAMASAVLLKGTPRPRGGYELKRSLERILLMEIVRLFDAESEDFPCPFGPHWCGKGAPCLLHDSFNAIRQRTNQFHSTTTLVGFARPDPKALNRI